MEYLLAFGGTAVVMLALIKMELIKSLASKLGAAKYSIPIHIMVLGLVAVLSLYLTSYLPGESPTTSGSNQEKTEFAQNVDAVQDGIETVENITGEIIDNKHKNDSLYEATRERQWVYQIGDIVSDEDILFDTYSSLSKIEGISVFKIDNSHFFLFKDERKSELAMKDSLISLSQKFDDPGLKCRVVDVVANCNKRQRIVRTDDIKIKQGKEKIFLPCYECGK